MVPLLLLPGTMVVVLWLRLPDSPTMLASAAITSVASSLLLRKAALMVATRAETVVKVS
jgi:hypothetical protein